jgi:hypothetical protein
MEILFEVIVYWVCEFIAWIGFGFANPSSRHNPLKALPVFAILGGIFGGVSLLLFRTHFIADPRLRLISLFVTPVVVGVLVAILGKLQRRFSTLVVPFAGFSYGFVFAFTMAIVRFLWAK